VCVEASAGCGAATEVVTRVRAAASWDDRALRWIARRCTGLRTLIVDSCPVSTKAIIAVLRGIPAARLSAVFCEDVGYEPMFRERVRRLPADLVPQGQTQVAFRCQLHRGFPRGVVHKYWASGAFEHEGAAYRHGFVRYVRRLPEGWIEVGLAYVTDDGDHVDGEIGLLAAIRVRRVGRQLAVCHYAWQERLGEVPPVFGESVLEPALVEDMVFGGRNEITIGEWVVAGD